MNKKFKAIATAMAVLAMVLTGFAMQAPSAMAEDNIASASSYSKINCSVSVDRSNVPYNGTVTVSWTTDGANSVTIDGTAVSELSGSRTFTLTQSRTFELKAFGNGGSPCEAKVTVGCEPPPPQFCELKLIKAVDKTTAKPGDKLTYTIDIENTGTKDCTGSGVRIEDVIDDNLTFVSHTVSSNIKSGYNNTPVYTSSDRTLHFNGDTLKPGETGRMIFVGEVMTPSQCGNFEIKNKAKATAKELNNYQNWSYSNLVKTDIDNDCYVPAPSCDLFEAIPSTIVAGDSSVLNWETTNATDVSITNVGTGLDLDGSATITPAVTTTYTLTATGANNQTHTCTKTVTVTDRPVPSCDLFEATPPTIVKGESTILTWETTNVTEVIIDNAVGATTTVDGSYVVTPLATVTYTLTAIGANNDSDTCTRTVTVTEDSVPFCKAFEATPNNLPVGGGNVTLNWEVIDATNVSISPTVGGGLGLIGSTSVPVTQSTTFTLTASDIDGDEISCTAPVTVSDPEPDPFTCEGNVVFTASPSSIKRGQNVTLDWSTTGVDSVSITHINLPGKSGSEVVTPSDDITYILTATKDDKSIDCPVSIEVDSGGGGGGSSSPRCELSISEKKIKLGEEVTITWDTSRATEVTLTDDKGKELFTTDDYLSSEKEDYYDGSITLKPTRDTKYTLIASKGSKEDECEVEVELEDDVVVLQTRDQQPLVAGISLSQVPYTGFEAGPFMTLMFYVVLVAWALYVAYFIAIRNRAVAKSGPNNTTAFSEEGVIAMKQAEERRPDLFVASVSTATAVAEAPSNLPVGSVVGYENLSPVVSDATVESIENRAHSQHALISSDAVRHFVATTESSLERNEALDSVIAEAKKTYPLEDGWVVINEERMRELCQVCMQNEIAHEDDDFIPTVVPEGTGSLAEAIVTGNVVAAYELLGNRPMFSLADAAADLDALYRNRLGSDVKVSELLLAESRNISDEDIKNMIAALTGALDGTYTDEASAVKMAIMKAIRIVG